MTAHLTETAASKLALSDGERIRHIKKPRWIGYGRAKEILDMKSPRKPEPP